MCVLLIHYVEWVIFVLNAIIYCVMHIPAIHCRIVNIDTSESKMLWKEISFISCLWGFTQLLTCSSFLPHS